MDTNIFKEADEEINLIKEIIKVGCKFFPDTYIPTVLVKQGYTIDGGMAVPIDAVSYKFIYESYEKQFYYTFMELFFKLSEEINSYTTEFALRTLFEMGVESSFILFDDRVEKNDKQKYILMSVLADYFSLIENDETNREWFNQLLEEHKGYLRNDEETKLCQLVAFSGKDEYWKNVKEIREICSNTRSSILNKYAQKSIYNLTTNAKMLKSGLSHILHGDILLIGNMLKKESFGNHLYRLYANLTISGVDFLSYFGVYVKNDDFSNILKMFDIHSAEHKRKFEASWKNHSSDSPKIEIVSKL